jgi:hypothetical protein
MSVRAQRLRNLVSSRTESGNGGIYAIHVQSLLGTAGESDLRSLVVWE